MKKVNRSLFGEYGFLGRFDVPVYMQHGALLTLYRAYRFWHIRRTGSPFIFSRIRNEIRLKRPDLSAKLDQN